MTIKPNKLAVKPSELEFITYMIKLYYKIIKITTCPKHTSLKQFFKEFKNRDNKLFAELLFFSSDSQSPSPFPVQFLGSPVRKKALLFNQCFCSVDIP